MENTPAGRSAAAQPDSGLTTLERNILRSKGVLPEQIDRLIEAGIRRKEDFKQVGDPGTLADLCELPPDVAERVMAWALGATPRTTSSGDKIIVETADAVLCVHCNTRQPKDYKSGDLCVACGRQAEPVMACFWCGASGPGKHCRRCGAEFVPTAELELGILLKREGVPKDDIPPKLRSMTAADKDALWGRARRY